MWHTSVSSSVARESNNSTGKPRFKRRMNRQTSLGGWENREALLALNKANSVDKERLGDFAHRAILERKSAAPKDAVG